MADPRTLIITAPRGSGGSYTHLSRIVPRLIERMRPWSIELHAPRDVLRACFGRDDEPWMRLLSGGGYAQRLRWEFVDLPRKLRSSPHARIWSPFGPPLNLRLASHTAWMSRNIIPLLPTSEWELSAYDHVRLRIMRRSVVAWARNARLSMSVSNHARDRLAALARVDRARIEVIPHGIDVAPQNPTCSTPDLERLRATRYVLHIGQPIAYRRTRELIEGYAILCGRRADTPPLLMAGKARDVDAAYERECLRLAEPLVRQGKAVILGQLKHEDALALMASAHAFVYPSVHENCPNIVLEALAAGRVAVYADIAAVRELADDAAVYVQNPQPGTMAEALELALFDAEARARLALRANIRAGRFTWDATGDRTAQALERAFA